MNEERQVAIRQPLSRIRWQQVRLLRIVITEAFHTQNPQAAEPLFSTLILPPKTPMGTGFHGKPTTCSDTKRPPRQSWNQTLRTRTSGTVCTHAASATFLLACGIGIPLGVMSAIKRYTLFDHTATFISLLGVSMPSFWLAIMAIILFSVQLGWLPSSGMSPLGGSASGWERFLHLLMPMVVLAVAPIAEIIRYTRSAMLDTLQDDYVRTARAKGL